MRNNDSSRITWFSVSMNMKYEFQLLHKPVFLNASHIFYFKKLPIFPKYFFQFVKQIYSPLPASNNKSVRCRYRYLLTLLFCLCHVICKEAEVWAYAAISPGSLTRLTPTLNRLLTAFCSLTTPLGLFRKPHFIISRALCKAWFHFEFF